MKLDPKPTNEWLAFNNFIEQCNSFNQPSLAIINQVQLIPDGTILPRIQPDLGKSRIHLCRRQFYKQIYFLI